MSSKESGASTVANSFQFARIAALFWKVDVPREGPTLEFKQQRIEEVCKHLNEDPRVIELRRPRVNEHFMAVQSCFPSLDSSDSDALLTGDDGFGVFFMSAPVLFKVRVPEKNQPKHHGADDVPSDTYWIAWDGMTAIVLWEQGDDYEPLSGGHIVASILGDAVGAMGDDLYMQACSPSCDNIFLHTSMRIAYDENEPLEGGILVVERQFDRAVEVLLPEHVDKANGFSVLNWLYLNLGGAGRLFGLTKNYARRLLDLKEVAQAEVTHLLLHYYNHTRLASMPIRASYRNRWNAREWRRHSRNILAGIWLSLANIETIRHEWHEYHRAYVARTNDCGIDLIFSGDTRNDRDAVRSLETTQIESAIRQVSGNLDNRITALAAGGGAIAGGIAGALATLLN